MQKLYICLLSALLGTGLAAPTQATGSINPILQATDLVYTSGAGFAQGAALLTRFKNKIRMDINASQLGAYDAHTVWWVVFNNPEYCGSDGCNAGDFPANGGDPRVNASVFWATGFVADASGMATVSTYVSKNQPWGQVLFGPTLQNVRGAEVHALIQTHGAASPALAQQLSENGAACNPTCAAIQAAVFLSPT